MKQPHTLDQLSPGERAIVKKVNVEGDKRRRFLDLGIIEHTMVECVGKSPGGDPTAYLIRGAVIAIRASDCKGIEICQVGKEDTSWV